MYENNLKYKIGDEFYLIGTKKKFRIIDITLGGNYCIKSKEGIRCSYVGDISITEVRLDEKYIPIRYEII